MVHKRRAMQRTQDPPMTSCTAEVQRSLADLPDELVLSHVLGELSYVDLSRFALVSRRLRRLSGCNKLWKQLFTSRWGASSPLLYEDAANLAGSWRNLMRSKHETDASSGGWTRPCEFELKAALQKLSLTAKERCQGTQPAPVSCKTTTPGSPTSIMDASTVLSPAPSASSTRSVTMSGCIDGASSLSGSPGLSSPFAVRLAQQASLNSRIVSGSSPASSSGCSAFREQDEGMLTRSMTMSSPPTVPPEVQIVYLLDGSGSVSEEDFNEMRRFVCASAPIIFETLGVGNQGKVGVIQFSTEPRVELPLAPLNQGVAGLAASLEGMVRMNGGTNIATAIARAGALMKADDQAALNPAGGSNNPNNPPQPPPPGVELPPLPGAVASPPPPPPPLPPSLGSISMEEAMSMSMLLGMHGEAMDAVETELFGSPSHARGDDPLTSNVTPQRPVRLLLLLTDGRVDTYQAREARNTACRLADELWGCTLAAFGVGRGVDRAELLHIIDTPHGDASSRYLDLMVRDDAPW